MRLKLVAALATALALAACGEGKSTSAGPKLTLLNVSYDPTRELYEDFNADFVANWKSTHNQDVTVNMSHGGSGKQARAVVDGLEADVVTLALEGDINLIARETKKIPEDWRTRLPSNSAPYTSTIVFLVRAGNPKQIKDWPDVAKAGVAVITPNPKTSGGARWNYLAAWAYADRAFNHDEQKTKDFVGAIYRNAPVLDTGARGSTTTFAQRGIGDVLLTWENEAYLTLDEFGANKYEIVYPSLSILAEPPVAVVDGNAEKHGTKELANAYLNYLYSPAGQRIIAKHYFRPNQPEQADIADRSRFRQIEMVKVDDLFGGWKQAQAKHFDEGGVYDQIFKPAK
jgi:sulfate transport system substrate-binding protein